jgi:hypothetical protein
MIIKKNICVLLFWTMGQANAQGLMQHLSNATFQYEVARYSSKFLPGGKVKPTTYMITTSVSEEVKEEIRMLDTHLLLDLLNNEGTDWATNLVLYEIFKKDASLIWFINREDWLLAGKTEDLYYWWHFLESREKQEDY